jgi:branched-chain amino acid transport system permease protein
VAALTFGIGVAVTAAGGMVFGATGGGFNPNTGYDLISRLLAIIILGGLGSIAGALVAAVFMITLEGVVDVLWSPSWSVVVFYGALVLMLVVRPQGLFGRSAVRAQ